MYVCVKVVNVEEVKFKGTKTNNDSACIVKEKKSLKGYMGKLSNFLPYKDFSDKRKE